MAVMRITRGTTPVIASDIPDLIPLYTAKDIWMSIEQQDNIIIHKTLENKEVLINGQTCVMALSQEDTLRLLPHQYATIGVRILLANGQAYASDITKDSSIQVFDIVKEGVIT